MFKRLFFAFVFLALLSTTLSAQYAGMEYYPRGDRGGLIMGGVGYSKINDESYFAIQFRPELAIGKLGIGLDVNLLYDTESGHIRSKDWDSGYDYFRILRYIRWGRKWDPLYARVGTLDAARLGHGFIMNYYTNEANYDERKIGLAFDVDMGKFGFESVASNLGRAELIGLRGYYRPLRGIVNIPLIKNFAVGATFARDFDPDAWSGTDDGVSAYGFDVEMPILDLEPLNMYSKIYFDWAQIQGFSALEGKSRTFGAGQAAGISFDWVNFLGVIDLSARVERRWLGEEFRPSFFDPFYEIQRYMVDAGVELYKTDMLINLDDTKGVFGELYGSLLGNKVRLLGMLTKLDHADDQGNMHLAAEALDLIPTLALHATYDKMRIETIDDVFTLDNQSIARVGVGYKVTPYLIMFMDYIWTYVETEPGSRIYKPQERVEPRLVFAYEFK